MFYINIQNDLIKKYNIDICDGSKCSNGDWSRTHAHIRQRRVCKWKQANSIDSTFTLLHEIGHIENNKGHLRRCEEEYFATVWAINICKELGIEINKKIINRYQNYIDMELARGLRRHGSSYCKEYKLVV